MNNELHSLPEALAAELRQLASQALPSQQESQSLPPSQAVVPIAPQNPVHKALLEVAQSTPELFAALIVASLGYDGVAVTETRTTVRDEVVELHDQDHVYSQVMPMTTTNTIHREVRLARPHRERRL
jgi:hypothetical protein